MTDALISVAITAAFVFAIVHGLKVSILGFKCRAKPATGELWMFAENANGDPWATAIPVKIIAVRDGWVRYAYPGMRANSLEDDKFRRMYRPYEPDVYGDEGVA